MKWNDLEMRTIIPFARKVLIKKKNEMAWYLWFAEYWLGDPPSRGDFLSDQFVAQLINPPVIQPAGPSRPEIL